MARTATEAAGVSRRRTLSLGTVLISLMASGAAAAPGATRTVTLITGDQVVISNDGKQSVTVIPRKGRESIVFATTHQRLQDQPESLLVIPADAQSLIDADRLDRRLFDVNVLLESNYDDGKRPHLPLVVTYEQKSGMARAASASLAGAAVTTTFASVNGVAAKPAKQELGQFWDSLTSGSISAKAAFSAQSGSIRKIWLDVQYKLSLAESVPQVGAPLAWQSGYDGTGTVVGIIDTGLDTAHPDLVGKMVLGTGFTHPGGTAPLRDQHGHGTHVAGIITGTGAASNGRYRGVAPGAQLAIFDACDPVINGGGDGCTLSTILEGVHWMAENGVKIVNMSLGTGNTPEIDPLEEAIQRLSEQHGILYVIAAGNSGGPGGEFNIDSPGSTLAALTVGAVDKSDVITDFSSRGPLPAFDGYRIKPDITGPGFDITSAAASTGSETGGEGYYIAAGGTSMATPHVAGAAAILLQRHPSWNGEQLKSALMSTAQYKPNTTMFEQGAGRLDVPAALATTVTALPASLSLGWAEFPHDDDEIITRAVTYRNESATVQTLTLHLNVTGPDGAAPPAGMLSLDRTTVTLPANGTATVTLTANTRLQAASGWFTGKLVATSGGVTSSIPLSIHREQPMFHLTLRHIGRDGADALDYTTTLVPIDRCLKVWPAVSSVAGDVTLRIPVAHYAIQSHFPPITQSDSNTLLLYGDFAHDGAGSLTLDARDASLVGNTKPTATATSIWTRAEYEATTACGSHVFGLQVGTETDLAPVYLGYLGQPAAHIRGYVSEQWQDTAQADETNAPALYAASFSEPGKLPIGAKTIPPGQLSTVRARYGATVGSDTVGSLTSAVDVPGPAPGFGTGNSVMLPLKRTEYYYSTDPNVRWITAMSSRLDLGAPSVQYAPGSMYMTRWNDPPYAPALPNYNPSVLWAYRTGNAMTVQVPVLGDRYAHVANLQLYSEDDIAQSALYRNGERIAGGAGSCTSCIVHHVEVAPEPATYRLESSVTQSRLPLSTRVVGAWTFQSQNVPNGATAQLPLITLQFKPVLNELGQAVRGAQVSVPVSVQQLDQQGAPQVSNLTIEASFDDGASWSPVTVTGSNGEWIATLQHPQNAEYVSLRANVAGVSSNTAEITVIRAYELTDPVAAR